MVTTLMKIGLALVIFCPINSNASDDISRKADRYAALFERYGWHIEKKDVAIIDRESRRYLSLEEWREFGNAVGSVECWDEKIPNYGYISTGYVVASNVIKIAGHGLYKKDKRSDGLVRRKKAFNSIVACSFGLRDWETGKVTYFRFKQIAQCPGFAEIAGPEKCDWAIVQLDRPVPDSIKPLNLGLANGDKLVGKSVTAVGHHNGVEINGKTVHPASKLVDSGHVRAKPPRSLLYGRTHMIAYTADTNDFASGQPVMVKIKGKWIVIASHSGEGDFDKIKQGSWNGFKFFNYAELINAQMIEQIRQFAPAAEKSRFDAAIKSVLPYNQIEN